MEGIQPTETFPLIGTVENPALFSDGRDLFLSYEIAPAAGDGIAILSFSDVIHFEQNPINVEGLRDALFPTKPWDFTEVLGSDRTIRGKTREPRFWTISFNDVTVEVVFSKVHKVYETREIIRPSDALAGFLRRNVALDHPQR